MKIYLAGYAYLKEEKCNVEKYNIYLNRLLTFSDIWIGRYPMSQIEDIMNTLIKRRKNESKHKRITGGNKGRKARTGK